MPPKDAVAIVGYAYRMPGGIRTDTDLWQLLSERDIVQEPVIDWEALGWPAPSMCMCAAGSQRLQYSDALGQEPCKHSLYTLCRRSLWDWRAA